MFRVALRRRILAAELVHPLVAGAAKSPFRRLQTLGRRRLPGPDEAAEQASFRPPFHVVRGTVASRDGGGKTSISTARASRSPT